MLDGIPFGGAAGVVTDRHGEAISVGEAVLEGVFPGPVAVSVAAAAVGEDQNLLGVGVAAPAVVEPPFGQVVDGEGGGVVGGADEEAAVVGCYVVDAVGQGDAFGVGAEVVVVDPGGCLGPGGAVVLEVADQFTFLGVDADDGQAGSGEGFALGGDVGL